MDGRTHPTSTRWGGRIARAILIAACVAGGTCGAGAPTTPSEAALLPALGSPSTPFVAVCGAAPNFLSEPGELARWTWFPLVLSIDAASLAQAGDARATYDTAIREGAGVWAFVTGGVIGQMTLGSDLDRPDLVVRAELPDADARSTGSPARFDGELVGGSMRRGTIRLFPANIKAPGASLAMTVANVVAHEMGHALGILKHSPDPTDLMHGFGNADRVARPWVMARDLNTLADAYCR